MVCAGSGYCPDTHRASMKLLHWANTHPQSVATLSEARREKVRCAPASGFHSLIHGLRETEDLDIFTHPDDFERLCALLPDGEVIRSKSVAMRGGAGEVAEFESDEFTTILDNVPVQVVKPLSPVIIDGHEYDLSLTDYAAAHLYPCVVGGAIISMIPEVDSQVMKALYQRTHGKHDWSDSVGLVPYGRQYGEYLSQRAAECRFTDREYEYLGAASMEYDRLQYMAPQPLPSPLAA